MKYFSKITKYIVGSSSVKYLVQMSNTFINVYAKRCIKIVAYEFKPVTASAVKGEILLS